MRPRFLHCHSTFGPGGKEARAVRLMNAFGDAAGHVVLSATPDHGARAAIAPGIDARFPDDAPPLVGKPAPARYLRLARYMAGFDLVLTYNWGAMDAVAARRLYAPAMRLPPLVHHEDGFNADEAGGRKPVRTWFRRLALPAAARVVVPSHLLQEIAAGEWRQAGRIERIANGVDLAAFARPFDPAAMPALARRPGEIVIGTIAGLRPVKALDRLVAAVARLPRNVRLVIVGEGPERTTIEAAVRDHGVGGRVLLTGFVERPERVVGGFDIVALSSLSEQQPLAVIEAMAAGLPIVSTDVGDVDRMVAVENRRFVVPEGDVAALARALAALAEDAALRAMVGEANREKARSEFDEERMIARYRALYFALADGR